MKKVDVTNAVMEKVVSFEKKRVRRWLGRFLAILIGLLSVLGILLWAFQKELVERGILDLLSLAQEDREIIGQFWQDTLGVIWEELPQRLFLLLLLAVIIFIVFVVVSRKKLRITRKKMGQLEKYKISD